jgi:nitroreductase
MSGIVDTIQGRRSVRTFENKPLTPEDRAYVEGVIQSIETPFGAPVEFRLLDAAEHGLKSPVIVGVHEYVAAKVERVPGAELALGFAFECFCLRAAERGLGTVMLAASLSRKSFEEGMEVGPGEVMPVASPVGYPAAKLSLRESMMRKAIKSDERLPFSQIFFNGSFNTPLSPSEAGSFAEPLQMLRLAPSATNKQPWRAVVNGDTAHFFEEHSLKESALGDIQKVDMGIALSHFWLAAQEQGLEGRFITCDPSIAVPQNTEYITSFEAAR